MKQPRIHGYFFYLCTYLGIGLLFHVLALAGSITIPAGREDLIAASLASSTTLTLQFARYALTVLGINLLPLAPMLLSLRVVEGRLRQHGISALSYFALTSLCLWLAVLFLNALYFPRSSFTLLIPGLTGPGLWLAAGVTLCLFVALGVAPALWRIIPMLSTLVGRPLARIAVTVALAIGLINPLYSNWAPQPAPNRQPDIIIIGLDSVTPLHLAHNPGKLPKLEGLLHNAMVFDNALTPLARTFPAWTSILTARYPVHTGARFNLTSFKQVDDRTTLPKLLKTQGYTTVYAQDERKFNNLDKSFGFDTVVGPKVGAAEFVLTKIADHPMANLSLLTPWAEKLFPFIAVNRAANLHYDPDTFVTAITESLPSDRSKPLFLAAHFCLAHYPYTWRTQGRSSTDAKSFEQQHVGSIASLELQIDSLLQRLRAAGRLDNAILVILSDHGEAVAYDDGLWPSADKQQNPQDISEINNGMYTAFQPESGFTGHGVNVLDRTEYQTLLAFHGFGELAQKFPTGESHRLASLVDIMPTLLGALGQPSPANIDGINLLAAKDNSRVLPAETGIRFIALNSVIDLDENKLLQESREYYRIDPDSARLIVKPERYRELVSTKDIALHSDEWMLAFLRKDYNAAFPRPVLLVHKPSGAWTLGNDQVLIARAPMATLIRAANNLYGKELDDFRSSWVFRRSVIAANAH